MGAAWCRERAAQAHDSKSPLDRVIVKCVNQMSPAERPAGQLQGPAKYPRLHIVAKESSASEWHDVALRVPDLPAEGGRGTAPIPPPRKKRTPAPAPEPKKVPEAPAIYLEVDTPLAQHRAKSSPVVYSEDDLLRLPKRSKSSMSLRSASPVSEATAERLDNYMKSCRSFGSLRPEELIDEINQALSDSSEDSWGGLDDWDLGFVEHFDTAGGSPPLTPTSQLASQNSPTRGHNRAEFVVGEPRPEKKKKKKRRSSKESVRRRLRKPEAKDADVLAPPANFQTDPKSHLHSNKGGSSLIKPSQISVQDFLRRSNDDKAKPPLGLPELTLDVPTENSSFSFDFSKGLMPPRSPQIEIPGTPNTPRGLSRCSSPLPAMFHGRTPNSSPTHEDEASSNLMRILQEYHCTADMIGDRDAKKILEELGIPENLLAEVPEIHKPLDNGGSALSSMTPSLTELEASLSELLEASAVSNDDDEFEEELQHQASTPRNPPKKDTPVDADIAQQVPMILASKPEDFALTETDDDLPKITTTRKLDEVKEVKTKRAPAPPHKDTPLDVVIAQQVPTILASKPGDIANTDASMHKSNRADDDLSPLTTPAAGEAKRSGVVTLLNVA